jgi:hypothetical protein
MTELTLERGIQMLEDRAEIQNLVARFHDRWPVLEPTINIAMIVA